MTFVRSAFVRMLKLLTVILIVSFLTFMLTKLLPGSPVNLILGSEASNPEARAALEARLGLDEPILVQYWNYITGVLSGDLGYSYLQEIPTTTYLAQRLPATIELMILAQFFSIAIAIPVALYSAYKANSAADKLLTAGSFGLISIPAFALAPFLVYLFAIRLGWVPSGGYARITEEGLVENLRSIALPLLVLITGLTAVYTRLLRSDLIATLQEDFVLMARSKGLTTRHILLRHALRPSSFSLLTVFAINFGTLIGGSIIVEVFFSIPGVGSLLIEQIFKREYLVVQGVVLVIATVFVVVNFITDLLYAVLDPRVRRAGVA
jgi:peptide/nickel transport system permease protein